VRPCRVVGRTHATPPVPWSATKAEVGERVAAAAVGELMPPAAAAAVAAEEVDATDPVVLGK